MTAATPTRPPFPDSPRFIRKRGPLGLYVSTCTSCGSRVATALVEEDLARPEQNHLCNEVQRNDYSESKP